MGSPHPPGRCWCRPRRGLPRIAHGTAGPPERDEEPGSRDSLSEEGRPRPTSEPSHRYKAAGRPPRGAGLGDRGSGWTARLAKVIVAAGGASARPRRAAPGESVTHLEETLLNKGSVSSANHFL